MVEICSESGLVSTRGLAASAGIDVVVEIDGETSHAAAERFLRFLVQYVEDVGDVALRAGETIAYGSWVVRFNATDAGDRLSVSEKVFGRPDGDDYQRGLAFSEELLNRQASTARAFGAEPAVPYAQQMAAVWKGVFAGEPVQGVRYPAPDHMSGWYLTTPSYPGDVKALEIHHVVHLIERCAPLAGLLALPPGFSFDTSPPATTADFDPSVAEADPG